MIELVQLPWSPFCIVQRRILEFSGVQFKITNLPRAYGDRSLVWKLTKKKYYAVPVIRDGAKVIYESGDDTQDIARHLDAKLKLGLFPVAREGEQSVLWRYFEHEIEAVGFRLNDIYWREFVTKGDELPFLRHKEHKLGRGCIDQWRAQQKELLAQLEQRLVPFEEMLAYKPFLLDQRPRFVDFDLYGMLGSFLYSGNYRLPAAHTHLGRWHRRMTRLNCKSFTREKELHL